MQFLLKKSSHGCIHIFFAKLIWSLTTYSVELLMKQLGIAFFFYNVNQKKHPVFDSIFGHETFNNPCNNIFRHCSCRVLSFDRVFLYIKKPIHPTNQPNEWVPGYKTQSASLSLSFLKPMPKKSDKIWNNLSLRAMCAWQFGNFGPLS